MMIFVLIALILKSTIGLLILHQMSGVKINFLFPVLTALICLGFQEAFKTSVPAFMLLSVIAELICYFVYLRLSALKNLRTGLFFALYTMSLLYFGRLVAVMIADHFFKGQISDFLALILAFALVYPLHLALLACLGIKPRQLLIAEQEHDSENPSLAETKIEQEQNQFITISSLLLTGLYLLSNLLGSDLVTVSYAICFIVMLCVSHIKYQVWEVQRLQRYLESQRKNMVTYKEQVDESYETVRAFRHDFANILISMRESIATQEMDVIQATYNHILEGSNEALNKNRSEVIKLSRIKVPEVKSVVMAKILAAENRGVRIEIELTDEISDLRLNPLDIVRLFGIVLENAIESALETANPQVIIALFNSGESTYFVVENNMVLENLPTSLIFKQGYSTKAGGNRGTGLATLHELLANNPTANFSVRAKDYKFRIELEMR
jgi:two-component system sensor histidine kinase AgrC